MLIMLALRFGVVQSSSQIGMYEVQCGQVSE